MHLKELPQLESAPPEEKLELIDELWDSIPYESLPTPSSHLEELNRRLAELEGKPAKALSPEDARKRLKSRTGL